MDEDMPLWYYPRKEINDGTFSPTSIYRMDSKLDT